jgi:hypothetical protein
MRDEKFIQNVCRKPEGKRTLGRPRRTLKDNIRTDLTETGPEVVD